MNEKPSPAPLLEAVERYLALMYDCDVSRCDQVFAPTAQLHGLRDGKLNFYWIQVNNNLQAAPNSSRETMPELEGIRFEEGRYGVIYSKYDLSCSLEGNPSAKCIGYDSDGAAKIGVNVVLYSMSP